MKSIFSLLFLLTLKTTLLFSQKGHWGQYVAEYENGPGSTTVNLDLMNSSSKINLPFVIITGLKIQNCDSTGLPLKSETNTLKQASEEIYKLIGSMTTSELVGTFTYQCRQLNYIYVSDTTEIREKSKAFYQSVFDGYDFYFNIRFDKDWEGYREFLYPNEEILLYIKNERMMMRLKKIGDDVFKARQVKHWLYFPREEDRNMFEAVIKEKNFSVEGKSKLPNSPTPYRLHISGEHPIDLKSINEITLELREKALEFNGYYDGWETFIAEKED